MKRWLVVTVGLAVSLIPTTAQAAPSPGGWTVQAVMTRPFADNSPWNTPIPANASFGRTNSFQGDQGWMTSEENSNPIYIAKPSDPILTFSVVRSAITHTFRVRGPANLIPKGGDNNLSIVDLGTNRVWDFIWVTRTGPTTFRPSRSVPRISTAREPGEALVLPRTARRIPEPE